MNKPPTYLVPTREKECKPGNPEATHIPHNNNNNNNKCKCNVSIIGEWRVSTVSIF